jgi:hypothetical protein
MTLSTRGRAVELQRRELGKARQFSVEICEEKSSVGNGLSAEAEKFPLLEDVAGKQLVNTQQAGKYLLCVLVIREVWRSAMAL